MSNIVSAKCPFSFQHREQLVRSVCRSRQRTEVYAKSDRVPNECSKEKRDIQNLCRKKPNALPPLCDSVVRVCLEARASRPGQPRQSTWNVGAKFDNFAERRPKRVRERDKLRDYQAPNGCPRVSELLEAYGPESDRFSGQTACQTRRLTACSVENRRYNSSHDDQQ